MAITAFWLVADPGAHGGILCPYAATHLEEAEETS